MAEEGERIPGQKTTDKSVSMRIRNFGAKIAKKLLPSTTISSSSASAPLNIYSPVFVENSTLGFSTPRPAATKTVSCHAPAPAVSLPTASSSAADLISTKIEDTIITGISDDTKPEALVKGKPGKAKSLGKKRSLSTLVERLHKKKPEEEVSAPPVPLIDTTMLVAEDAAIVEAQGKVAKEDRMRGPRPFPPPQDNGEFPTPIISDDDDWFSPTAKKIFSPGASPPPVYRLRPPPPFPTPRSRVRAPLSPGPLSLVPDNFTGPEFDPEFLCSSFSRVPLMPMTAPWFREALSDRDYSKRAMLAYLLRPVTAEEMYETISMLDDLVKTIRADLEAWYSQSEDGKIAPGTFPTEDQMSWVRFGVNDGFRDLEAVNWGGPNFDNATTGEFFRGRTLRADLLWKAVKAIRDLFESLPMPRGTKTELVTKERWTSHMEYVLPGYVATILTSAADGRETALKKAWEAAQI